MPDAPALRLTGVRKRFGDTVAVAGVDLDVPRGRITALLGPSGCGKTTALRAIAGLERIDGGQIAIDGVTVATPELHTPAERRRVGMVFQDYALFPHLTVLGNVEYGLADLPRHERREIATEALRRVGMADLLHRSPSALSGGQQQRVALARALAPSPKVILLDEPFSNLDAALRVQVREEVRAILKAADATAVFVTHDQEEALSLADEVAVMAEGQIHQVAPPHELYTRPATAFVARFVGDADIVAGRRVPGGRLATPLGELEPEVPVAADRADVVIRPEMVALTPDPDGDVTVLAVTYFGHDQLVQIRLADGTVLRARRGPDLTLRAGERVRAEVQGQVVAYPVAESDAAPVAAHALSA